MPPPLDVRETTTRRTVARRPPVTWTFPSVLWYRGRERPHSARRRAAARRRPPLRFPLLHCCSGSLPQRRLCPRDRSQTQSLPHSARLRRKLLCAPPTLPLRPGRAPVP